MKMFRKQEGFTLVELMVVVLIIGILVAIAVPVFLNASANAKLKSCQANQRTIEGAAQTYSASNNGTLPADVATLVPTYIKVSPLCSKTGLGYHLDVTDTAAGRGTVDGDGGPTTAGWSATGGAVHVHF